MAAWPAEVEPGLELVELGHREGELGAELLDALVAGLGALHRGLGLLARHRGLFEDLVRALARSVMISAWAAASSSLQSGGALRLGG